MALAQRIPTRYRVIHKPSESGGTPYITKYAMRLAAKKDTPPQTAKTAAKKNWASRSDSGMAERRYLLQYGQEYV